MRSLAVVVAILAVASTARAHPSIDDEAPPPYVPVKLVESTEPTDRHFILEASVGVRAMDLYGSFVGGGVFAASIGGEGTWVGGTLDFDGFEGKTTLGLHMSGWSVGGSLLFRATRRLTLALGPRMGMLSLDGATGDTYDTITLGLVGRASYDLAVSRAGALFLAVTARADLGGAWAPSIGLQLGVRAW